MKQVKAYVVSNNRILPDMARPNGRAILGSHLMRLHCPEIAAEAKPGQFVMVRCPDEVGILPRPFSIHRVRNEDIGLFYAVLEGGKGTPWLSRRQQHETLELFGPLGNGFSINSASKNLLLVAGGVGVAPLIFLAQQAVRERCSATLLLGAAATSQLYPRNLLPPKVKLAIATEEGSSGRKGRVTDLIPEFIGEADQVFACGPMAMYKDMHRLRNDLLKDKPTQVSLEMVMGCGRGICYGCTVKTKNGVKEACTDGPVFELDDILWDEIDTSGY
ncbi:MAG: dihydroorotate dehydrogenase electron transfer subunit [Chloroflexi bacterium]|nr:dihydroorotate dehydrogenase electron transfer subunit [Chloroflexota bacterium]